LPVKKEKILEAVKKAKERAGKRNFAQSVDLVVNFKNLDLSKPGNRITAEVPLPHGTGKPQKVAMFAEGELARKAQEAEVDLVLGRKEIEELAKDRKRAKEMADEYTSFLAQADLMPFIGKQLGPVLGPRGKMPRPLPPTADPKSLFGHYRGTARINVRDQLVVHLLVGKEEMSEEQLADNVVAVLKMLESKLPKGLRQVRSAHVKTTMGKPAKVGV
jgi:large subunit ribosomal protein L1